MRASRPAMPDPNSVSHALHALRDVLEREKQAGHSHLAISPGGLDRLRALSGQIRAPRPASAAPIEVKAKPPEPAPSPQPAVVAPAPAPAPAPLRPVGATKAEQLAWLAREVGQCPACRGLGTLRDTPVFATGNPDAALMLIGEAPGHEEERLRQPFVGPAGRKLDEILLAMGLRRPDDVYISNIVKFRPLTGDPRLQGTQNRKPTPGEMAVSIKYILAEIDIVRPKAIIALGATATEGLLEVSGPLASIRGRFYELRGIPVMVTYHPSYLLRAETDNPDKGRSEKRKVWEDMLQVMERLSLPISDRQRRFFA
jgi:uracil-DNA glycosylase